MRTRKLMLLVLQSVRYKHLQTIRPFWMTRISRKYGLLLFNELPSNVNDFACHKVHARRLMIGRMAR